MNRIDFQELAQTRLREAQALLAVGEWSGAYYLAGYAVECGLKACIARLTSLHEFPDKERAFQSYSHKVEVLVDAARLKSSLDAALNADPVMRQNWLVVKDWTEQARYRQWNRLVLQPQIIRSPTCSTGAFKLRTWQRPSNRMENTRANSTERMICGCSTRSREVGRCHLQPQERNSFMGYEALVTEQIKGGAVIAREFDHYAPIKVAFWLRTAEEYADWELCLASDQIDETNFYEAYGEVVRLSNFLKLPDIDFLRIKVLYGKSPVAEAAARITQEYSSQTGVRLRNQALGDVWADAIYLYPAPITAVAS